MATVYQASDGGETPQKLAAFRLFLLRVFTGMPAIALPGMNMPETDLNPPQAGRASKHAD
jgi:hypothetical protein